jgi:hypothetical protein
MSTYDDAIKAAADAFLDTLGSDEMADNWGTALDIKVGEDAMETGEVTDRQYHEVYLDIMRAAVAKEEAFLASLDSDEPCIIEEHVKVYLVLENGQWAIDHTTLDGHALDGLPDGAECRLHGQDCEVLRRMTIPVLPNGADTARLFMEQIGDEVRASMRPPLEAGH